MSQITERLLSTKRHTLGFIVGRQQKTRHQTIQLAKQGKVEGVRVCKGPKGYYLASSTAVSLYSLPTRVVTGRIGATRVAAKGRRSQ